MPCIGFGCNRGGPAGFSKLYGAFAGCNGRILENGNQGRLLVVWTVPVEMTAVSLENISCHAAQTIPHSKGPLIGTDLFDPMIPQSVTL
ncbi:hypothetical protein FZC84_21070 [Rossellomorea vietnamensis]|uniref:Uncharacterized protein n=1 Tax=Rossellomorea vietnamensis TaxID=218284 RepID=A0A5D4M3P1_9BACI|nr:hypothetical protein [Rossellomorea vietnamensis]TYR95923.1 hypothetical protein FZC84_21070 [Rossellomorea vietnamensis]